MIRDFNGVFVIAIVPAGGVLEDAPAAPLRLGFTEATSKATWMGS
jgi:hypothetical protein